MSYRIEKEENGTTAIVISGWEKGTAPDPYSGMNRMYSVNLTVPGEVSVGYDITANATSGGTLGNPIADSTRYFSYATPGVPASSPQSFAILDANGRVWESTTVSGTYAFLSSSNSTTGSSTTDGIAFYLGYLFKTRGANIDYWNGSTWVTGWQTTLTSGFQHFMYVGSDNTLYITNGNYIATVALANPGDPTTFDPSNAATYTFSNKKLQLPSIDTSLSLAEIGGGNTPNSTLLIGGTQNAVYPWDKTSSSFNLPIFVGDSYIKNIVSVNQNAFIFPGNHQGRGRIYITNGSQAEEWFKMPDYIFGIQDPYYEWGDAIFHRNMLLFGTFVDSNALTTQLIDQVWGIDLATKTFRSVSNIPANSTATANATCLISTGNLSVSGLGYIVAWNDNGSNPGIGYSGTTAGIGTAVINTDLIPVGTLFQKRTFSQIEFKLRSPLQSGESISIIPIVDGTAGSALTFDSTVTTGSISGVSPVNFQGAQWLQFQISLTGNSASSGVRLREIRLR